MVTSDDDTGYAMGASSRRCGRG